LLKSNRFDDLSSSDHFEWNCDMHVVFRISYFIKLISDIMLLGMWTGSLIKCMLLEPGRVMLLSWFWYIVIRIHVDL